MATNVSLQRLNLETGLRMKGFLTLQPNRECTLSSHASQDDNISPTRTQLHSSHSPQMFFFHQQHPPHSSLLLTHLALLSPIVTAAY